MSNRRWENAQDLMTHIEDDFRGMRGYVAMENLYGLSPAQIERLLSQMAEDEMRKEVLALRWQLKEAMARIRDLERRQEAQAATLEMMREWRKE